MGDPFDWSVKLTTSGEHPAVGEAVKLAEGNWDFATSIHAPNDNTVTASFFRIGLDSNNSNVFKGL